MPLFFPKRGIHLDLRIQTMPMGALRAQVRTMAEMNFNILLIEWEATFPFRTHPIISNQFAYTPAEIASFIGFCRDLGIEVIPLQQCFGHVEYILRHPRYAHLREDQADLCQICPSHPERALEIFRPISTSSRPLILRAISTSAATRRICSVTARRAGRPRGNPANPSSTSTISGAWPNSSSGEGSDP